MVPNLEWCKQNFTAFNAQYFGGKLPMPKFSYNCPKNTWGIYNCDAEYDNNGKITNIYNSGEMAFTKLYDRNEKSIQNTLLHEMIHMYCALVLRIVPKHDGNFEQLATKMRQDGWDISEINGKTDEDVLINGQDVPDMENNQGDNYVGGNQFFDTAQKMFGELQQLKVRLNNLQQAKAKMNECKKIIISEEQEQNLIKLLKESELQKAQMPVDKKMNKPYCIDPEKVLIVKKHLDNNFRKFNYTTLSGGKKKQIKIVGMMDGDNVLKYMYTDDLKDYLIDTFQKMFLDTNERDLFLTKVMDAWLNNKIGVHGTLDTNFLQEGIEYTPNQNGTINARITTSTTDADNRNADTRVFGTKKDIFQGDGSITSKKWLPMHSKFKTLNLCKVIYDNIISSATNRKKIQYPDLRDLSPKTAEAIKTHIDDYNSGNITSEDIISWASISKEKLELISQKLKSISTRLKDKNDNDKSFRYGVSKVPGTNVDAISLFDIDDFNFSDVAKHGEFRQGQLTDSLFNTSKDDREKNDKLVTSKGTATLKKIGATYDNGIAPNIPNNFSYDEYGNRKNYGFADENYTSFTQFISKSIIYSKQILTEIGYLPDVIISPPSSSKYNYYFCQRLSEKIGARHITDFFSRNIINVKFDSQQMLNDGYSQADVDKFKRDVLREVSNEIGYIVSEPISQFVDKYENYFSNIRKPMKRKFVYYDFNAVKQLLCQMSANALIKNLNTKEPDFLYKQICLKLSSPMYGGKSSRDNYAEEEIRKLVHSRELMYDYQMALKKSHELILQFKDRLMTENGIKVNALLNKFKITKFHMRQRKYLSNVYVVADKNLNENGQLFQSLANAKFLIFDEDMNSGATLKLSIDALLDKIPNHNENNIKCLVVGFSPKSN